MLKWHSAPVVGEDNKNVTKQEVTHTSYEWNMGSIYTGILLLSKELFLFHTFCSIFVISLSS